MFGDVPYVVGVMIAGSPYKALSGSTVLTLWKKGNQIRPTSPVL